MGFEYPLQSSAVDLLKTFNQWVVRGGKGGKQPFNPRGGPGSSTNKATWGTFDEVCAEAVQLKNCRPIDNIVGIGFVFTVDDPFVGIDLDHCIDETGKIAPWADEIVKKFSSYTEYSPSERGLHIFIKAILGGGDRGHDNKPSGHKSGGLEVYSWGRYFTFTGKTYPDASGPCDILLRQEILDDLVLKHFKDKSSFKSVADVPDIGLDATPPFEKFDALLENDPKFKKSWNHARRDLKDTSLSGYDMSLSTIAAFAGWSDAEIASLIISHRRKYGENEKCRRKDYLSRVLGLARSAVRENIDDREAQSRKTISDASGGTTEDVLGEISSQIGVSVDGVVKRGRENAFYYFVIDGKEVLIGDAADLLSVKIVRERIFDVTGEVLKPVKIDKWRQIVALFSPIMVTYEVAGGDRVEETNEWIEAYCERANIFKESEKSDAIAGSDSFEFEEKLWISVHKLFDWVAIRGIARGITHSGLRVRLLEAGYISRKFTARVDGVVKCRNYWAK